MSLERYNDVFVMLKKLRPEVLYELVTLLYTVTRLRHYGNVKNSKEIEFKGGVMQFLRVRLKMKIINIKQSSEVKARKMFITSDLIYALTITKIISRNSTKDRKVRDKQFSAHFVLNFIEI